ncbi:hypothetical protein PF006_g4261 [Phytophthora fragariae]|uniref:Ankyrin repeat protein n=1 Tax=Phytophthora fragariae TaxID=53985 RepID=A0A6A3UKT4_9STRA|nr:hypothetical protein PF006_g4261 [Phytophthora fragariae]
MNRFDIAKWLHDHQGLDYPESIVDELAQAGDLIMLTWLHNHDEGKWSKNTMNEAASCGHLDVVKFLHENRREGCTKQAMNNAAAARSDNIGALEFIRTHAEDCITQTVYYTGNGNDHPEVVKWYEDHYGNPRKRKTPYSPV